MKLQIPVVQFSCLLVLLFFLTSCVPDKAEPEVNLPEAPPAPVEKVDTQNQLPVQYQRPSYMVDSGNKERLDEVIDDVAIKVGASIRSTQGPQPLWDILKRLAALKKMSVSWASDVDQYVLVDVDINANDDFYVAIRNLLRQVDYYHEMQGSTIIVRYKETRQFHIAMPFLKQTYKTNVGGDVLGGSSDLTSTNVAGEISLSSEGVSINNAVDGKPSGIEFNTWNSIENNLNAILNIWTTDEVEASSTKSSDQQDLNLQEKENRNQTKKSNEQSISATFRRSPTGNTYFIDKPVGLITVTAPRPLLKKLEIYFKTLKKELYKQVSIEAKIIEVHLSDHSSIGLNWNMLLKNLSVASGQATFGQNRSHTTTNTTDSGTLRGYNDVRTMNTDVDGLTTTTRNITNTVTSVPDAGITAATIITNGLTEGIGGAISLATFSFDSFLNAVKKQGQTTILSNPKISVLNGQPALITVGRNVTYIDKIEAKAGTQNDPGTKYTVNTERVLSGVGLALTANILDDKEIILNLVPVTSQLEEPIVYKEGGWGTVGLPIVNVREMSTTVRVKDGEMLVIGGLISNVENNDGTFVPGTSNIPFFKYLFGYKEKTSTKRELIILLKPQII